MKKKIFFMLLSAALYGNFQVTAQWKTNGNNLAGPGLLGSTLNHPQPIVFMTDGVQYGTLTSDGKWGFGKPNPNTRVHINSVEPLNPLRVDVNNAPKLWVSATTGGVSVGSGSAAPTNGLFVNGNVGIGIDNPAAKVQITHNSTSGNPQLLLYESANDYARLNFKNANSSEYFGIAGSPNINSAAAKLNIHYDNNNILTVQGDGKVGVNNITPQVEFHINHGLGDGITNGLRLTNTGGNNHNFTWYVANGANELWLYKGAVLISVYSINGIHIPSDRRLKKDFESADIILPKIMQLNVLKYNFIQSDPGALKQYGMIAQDVEKIFPEMVKHTVSDNGSNDLYTMNYSALSVLAIKAIQEQQKQIDEQKKQIDELKQMVEKLSHEQSVTTSTVSEASKTNVPLTTASLEQNTPNPLSKTTSIRYNIPAGTKNAQLTIRDNSGKTVKQISLNAGKGIVNIDASALGSGTYNYTLTVGGKLIETKKMVVAH